VSVPSRRLGERGSVPLPEMPRTSEVELLRWPAEADRRQQLADRKVPRLLLVEAGVMPPPLDDDEDWICVPADERDIGARLRRLARSSSHEQERGRPRPDDDRLVLRHPEHTPELANACVSRRQAGVANDIDQEDPWPI